MSIGDVDPHAVVTYMDAIDDIHMQEAYASEFHLISNAYDGYGALYKDDDNYDRSGGGGASYDGGGNRNDVGEGAADDDDAVTRT